MTPVDKPGGADDLFPEQRKLLEHLLAEEGVALENTETEPRPENDRSNQPSFDPRGGVWGRVNASFFGDRLRPLFGIHHPPRSREARGTGVVLCHPIGQEYLRAHRAFTQLSNLLSREGFHVFRFDYFGTGDSAGDIREATVARWQTDVSAAIQELVAKSGTPEVSLVGLRFGAALAISAALRDSRVVRDIVLWDPVVSGKSYLRGLSVLHGAMLQDPWRFAVPRAESRGAHEDELLGFAISTSLRAEIERIRLARQAPPVVKRIGLLVSEDRSDYAELRDRLATSSVPVDYRVVPGAGEWDRLDQLEVALLPSRMLQAIVRALARDDA